MAEYSKVIRALVGLLGAGASGNELEVRKTLRQAARWLNDAAVATNTAISERPICTAKMKSRIVKVKFVPAASVTGTATDFFTLILRKRTAALPGTQVALISFAADTATTDDAAAFAEKDLLVAAYKNAAAETAFDLEEGDCVTAEVTKSSATGMTYPVGEVRIELEPRT